MAFYESLSLKFGKVVAEFVGLALPHASHGNAVGTSEAFDMLCLFSKMIVQRCPVGSERCCHERILPQGDAPTI